MILKKTLNESSKATIHGIFQNVKNKKKEVTLKESPKNKIKNNPVAGVQNKKLKYYPDNMFSEVKPKSTSRKTIDGLEIYTEEELNIGKGGNSALCPFDCNCCF